MHAHLTEAETEAILHILSRAGIERLTALLCRREPLLPSRRSSRVSVTTIAGQLLNVWRRYLAFCRLLFSLYDDGIFERGREVGRQAMNARRIRRGRWHRREIRGGSLVDDLFGDLFSLLLISVLRVTDGQLGLAARRQQRID